ncbi:MAG: ABC transporter ATP-binding protein [Lachnospiraceae bacterium]|nr:ABC transporter ATP-binding protein [Lachnospiraceae bacterium]
MEDINDSLNPVTKDAVPVDKTAAEALSIEPAPAGTETKVPADTGAATPAPKKKKKKKKKLPPKVIVVENLGVKFRIQEQKVDNLKEYFVRLIKRRLNYKEFWALKDVNLKIRKGDRVGILGLNGAGKSTLLKCIAGVLKPSEGTVTVKGNIVPLLELGAGFDKDYTGAENIYFYGSMLGYSKSFIKERFDEIVEFSELGSFINVPVKNYSSGMKARLGFSIATIVEPEILILDEVLSVGDAKFRKKSSKKLTKMMKKGVTVLFVSHSSEQVIANCNKAIILDHGHVIASGKAEKICAQYEEMISDKN